MVDKRREEYSDEAWAKRMKYAAKYRRKIDEAQKRIYNFGYRLRNGGKIGRSRGRPKGA